MVIAGQVTLTRGTRSARSASSYHSRITGHDTYRSVRLEHAELHAGDVGHSMLANRRLALVTIDPLVSECGAHALAIADDDARRRDQHAVEEAAYVRANAKTRRLFNNAVLEAVVVRDGTAD